MFYYAITLAFLFNAAHGANILILHPWYMKSQLSYFKPLSIALAKRNHSVTVLCGDHDDGFPEDKMEVLVTRGLEYPKFQWDKSHNFLQEEMHKHQFTTEFLRIFFASSTVRDLLSSNRTFDAVILNSHFFDAIASIPHRFKARSIEFRSVGEHPYSSMINGNPIRTDAGCRPDNSKFRNFVLRAQTTWKTVVTLIYRELVVIPDHQKLVDDLWQYDDHSPRLKDLLYNISAFMANSHPTLSSRKYEPWVQKEVAGVSIPWGVPRSTLPDVYEEFINKSSTGFILISWGSLNSAKEEVSNRILDALASLPYQVIWKASRSDFTRKIPSNVMISPWVPQLNLLGDPRIKLFWTHGGFGGLIEAAYYEIPVIVTPIGYDQPKNAAFMVENSMGLELSIEHITEDSLLRTAHEIIENPKYKKGARRVSIAFKNRLLPPLDEAIFWIEDVLHFPNRFSTEDNNVIALFILHNWDVFFVTFLCTIVSLSSFNRILRFLLFSRYTNLNSSVEKLLKND